MSFRATVESMSKIMDDMGITELNLERQFLFGVYRKHIHLSKQQVATTVAVAQTDAKADAPVTKNTINGYHLFTGLHSTPIVLTSVMFFGSIGVGNY